MERSFATEVDLLSRGKGQIVHTDGIVAVAKAMLQSGVAYVGGYQGAPVSHLLDLFHQARPLLQDLAVHFEANTNEASAAAMLGASIPYPLRGAVTWKSIVGTNVASDALSNLASAGVSGGTLIVLGEDYGEGASVIQERSHAFALKSSLWLLDPRPHLPTIVRLVQKSFELSEASHTPVMMELRIRACHLFGKFIAEDNVRPSPSIRDRIESPAPFDYARLSHPPSTFPQEKAKIEDRLPRARAFIEAHELNEHHAGDLHHVGLILQGGLYNLVVRCLNRLGLADVHGKTRIPLLVLNVTHPLCPAEIESFCTGKTQVLIVEEGAPEYLEKEILTILSRGEVDVRVRGKDLLPPAGEYRSADVLRALLHLMEEALIDVSLPRKNLETIESRHREVRRRLDETLPARPPTFCTGCPERPVFTALKLAQRELGSVHVSADIGCHSLGTFAPFHSGQTILGYGMSLAANSATAATQKNRPLSIMGDGGLWHNGMISGVSSSVFNGSDSVLIVLDNGYASATGLQSIPSSQHEKDLTARRPLLPLFRSLGVRWIRRAKSYDVRSMRRTLRKALRSPHRGLKVIVAQGECMLSRIRRQRRERLHAQKSEQRHVTSRFFVDQDVCTGDRSCIRLSGCPSLSVEARQDPLRVEPVVKVRDDCVGCGLCGEVAHAAALCPSFYEVRRIEHPHRLERLLGHVRTFTFRLLRRLFL